MEPPGSEPRRECVDDSQPRRGVGGHESHHRGVMSAELGCDPGRLLAGEARQGAGPTMSGSDSDGLGVDSTSTSQRQRIFVIAGASRFAAAFFQTSAK